MPFSQQVIRWSLVAGLVGAVVFLAFPEIDLRVAAQFHDERYGFPLGLVQPVRGVQTLLRIATASVVVVCLLLLVWKTMTPRHSPGRMPRAAIAFILLGLAVGPGLVVNTLFKDNWGRARPAHLDQFEGDKEFSPALVMADQCVSNCSFVSGDAAVAFYLAALAFVFPRRAARWLRRGIAFGLVIGMFRIGQGGHFVSDVWFAGVFTLLTTALIWQYGFDRGGLARIPGVMAAVDAIDRGARRLRRPLRRLYRRRAT